MSKKQAPAQDMARLQKEFNDTIHAKLMKELEHYESDGGS
jgi:hypothetical protein